MVLLCLYLYSSTLTLTSRITIMCLEYYVKESDFAFIMDYQFTEK